MRIGPVADVLVDVLGTDGVSRVLFTTTSYPDLRIVVADARTASVRSVDVPADSSQPRAYAPEDDLLFV